MADPRPYADADVETVKVAIGDCRYDDGSDGQARAVLDALTADGWAPVAETRAEVAEEIATYRDEQEPASGEPGWWAGYKEGLSDAAEIARQHTTPTEEPTP